MLNCGAESGRSRGFAGIHVFVAPHLYSWVRPYSHIPDTVNILSITYLLVGAEQLTTRESNESWLRNPGLLCSPSQGDCLLDNAFNCFGGSLGVTQPLKIGEIGRLQQTVKLNVCVCVCFLSFFFFVLHLHWLILLDCPVSGAVKHDGSHFRKRCFWLSFISFRATYIETRTVSIKWRSK